MLPLARRLLHASPPADPGVLASRLASRAVVRFRGPEAARFLNSLLTNDLLSQGSPASAQPQRYAPTPNAPARAPPPRYAALLTPQGRFLYDLFLYRPAPRSQMLDRTGSAPQTGERPGGEDGEGGEVLADVDAAEVDELLACFKRYRLRSKVEIDNVSEEFLCWQRFGSDVAHAGPSTQEPEAQSIGWGQGSDHAAESSAQGNGHGWQWLKDPRLDILGYRGIFPADTIPRRASRRNRIRNPSSGATCRSGRLLRRDLQIRGRLLRRNRRLAPSPAPRSGSSALLVVIHPVQAPPTASPPPSTSPGSAPRPAVPRDSTTRCCFQGIRGPPPPPLSLDQILSVKRICVLD